MKTTNFSKEMCQELINELSPKVQEILTPIGGHKVYHLEGNAWEHTKLVMDAMDPEGSMPLNRLVGLLHDIGKARFYKVDSEGWFTYPNHSQGGADMLSEFIPKDHELYSLLYWVIANHIKTLFFLKQDNIDEVLNSAPSEEAAELLLSLGIADILGSHINPECEREIKENKKILNFLNQQKISRFGW